MQDSITVTFKDDARTYTLSKKGLARYPDCAFLAKERFTKTNTYVVENYTYEEFELISRAINSYITAKEYIDNKEQLDYFGITCYFQECLSDYIEIW